MKIKGPSLEQELNLISQHNSAQTTVVFYKESDVFFSNLEDQDVYINTDNEYL